MYIDMGREFLLNDFFQNDFFKKIRAGAVALKP